MLQGASREVQRYVESNGVLSFKAYHVVHVSQRAFFFSPPPSLFFFLTIERAQCYGWKSDARACSFVLHEGLRDYTLSPVTNRWKPLGTRSFPRDQQVEDARGSVADDSETRPAKRSGRNRKEGGRWTIRELLLFQLVPELWNGTRVPLYASEQRVRGMRKEKIPLQRLGACSIFSFLMGQIVQKNDKYHSFIKIIRKLATVSLAKVYH